jgi:hypothetical protein
MQCDTQNVQWWVQPGTYHGLQYAAPMQILVCHTSHQALCSGAQGLLADDLHTLYIFESKFCTNFAALPCMLPAPQSYHPWCVTIMMYEEQNYEAPHYKGFSISLLLGCPNHS